MDFLNKHLMWVRCIGLLWCCGAAGGAVHALDLKDPSNVVELSVSAAQEVQQDWLTLTLTVTREGTEPAAVQAQVRQALDAALLEIKKTTQAGALEVHTGSVGLQPRYGSVASDNKINGWTGTADLVLQGNDFVRITEAAARARSMVIKGLVFSLSPALRAKAAASAQAQAIERFRVNAVEVAKGFGFAGYSLRQVRVVSDETAFNPRSTQDYSVLRASKVQSAPMPLEAGSANVVATVSGAIQLK